MKRREISAIILTLCMTFVSLPIFAIDSGISADCSAAVVTGGGERLTFTVTVSDMTDIGHYGGTLLFQYPTLLLGNASVELLSAPTGWECCVDVRNSDTAKGILSVWLFDGSISGNLLRNGSASFAVTFDILASGSGVLDITEYEYNDASYNSASLNDVCSVPFEAVLEARRVDMNGDGKTDLLDLILLRDYIAASNAYDSALDADRNGALNDMDITALYILILKA